MPHLEEVKGAEMVVPALSSFNSPVRSLQKPVRPRGRQQNGTKQITAPPATAVPDVGSPMEELDVATHTSWRVVSTWRT